MMNDGDDNVIFNEKNQLSFGPWMMMVYFDI